MRKKLMYYGGIVILVGCAGCAAPWEWWGGTDPNTGVEYQGHVTAAVEVIKGLPGVPFAGAIAGLTGLVAGAVRFAYRKKYGKENDLSMEAFVVLFNELKPELTNISSDEDLEAFLERKLPKDSKYGKMLYDAWKRLKGLE